MGAAFQRVPASVEWDASRGGGSRRGVRSGRYTLGEDYYDILGVKRGASDDEIKRSHRKLAKKFHPDRNRGDKGAEDRFKKIQAAYEVLSDQEKRAQYDQFGRAGIGHFAHAGGGDPGKYEWGNGSAINIEDLEDLFTAFGGGQSPRRASVFDQVFGGGRARGAGQASRQAVRGGDVDRHVALSFEQAIRGSTVDIDRIKVNQRRESISVRIPAGVKPGQRIRVRGKGNSGTGGAPEGDLFIVCDVHPHAYFRREDRDISIEVPVSVTEALLGTRIDVPTLHGMVTVTIPPGTSSGARLRLRGRGIALEGQPPGDQFVVIRVVTPPALSDEQKAAVEALAESLQHNPRADLPWSTPEDAS